MNKKLLLIVGILFVAVLILAAFYYLDGNSSNKDKQETPDIVKTEIESGSLASGFEQDLPVEPGSETKQNYEATSIDGRKQSTVSITTKKSLKEALNVYQAYFEKKGWIKVEITPANPDFPEAMFRRVDDILLISTLEDSQTGVRSIELSLTESPK